MVALQMGQPFHNQIRRLSALVERVVAGGGFGGGGDVHSAALSSGAACSLGPQCPLIHAGDSASSDEACVVAPCARMTGHSPASRKAAIRLTCTAGSPSSRACWCPSATADARDLLGAEGLSISIGPKPVLSTEQQRAALTIEPGQAPAAEAAASGHPVIDRVPGDPDLAGEGTATDPRHPGQHVLDLRARQIVRLRQGRSAATEGRTETGQHSVWFAIPRPVCAWPASSDPAFRPIRDS